MMTFFTYFFPNLAETHSMQIDSRQSNLILESKRSLMSLNRLSIFLVNCDGSRDENFKNLPHKLQQLLKLNIQIKKKLLVMACIASARYPASPFFVEYITKESSLYYVDSRAL